MINRYIGIGTMHPDHSSELDYIMRGNPENKPRLYRKKEMVGEIGWKAGQSTSRPKDLSGNFHGFKRGEFRQAAESENSHLYQNPYMEPLPSTKLPLPLNTTRRRVD